MVITLKRTALALAMAGTMSLGTAQAEGQYNWEAQGDDYVGQADLGSTGDLSALDVLQQANGGQLGNTARNAPVIIIQATSSSPSYPFCQSTKMRVYGNFGGTQGGDAFCAKQFGEGWNMASRHKYAGIDLSPDNAVLSGWIDSDENCNDWTTRDNSIRGTRTYKISGTAYSAHQCSTTASVVCCNF